MIGGDGSLRVPAKSVTWFQFLQLSRLTNSEQGGWDSLSHWETRGLEKLLNAEPLQAWTRNSLHSKTRPVPRKKNFRFNERQSGRGSSFMTAAAKNLTVGIDKLNENQLNSLLFHQNKLQVWGRLIGYEIYLADEAENQLKIDLLGKGEGFISIVELKQGKNRGHSPLMMLTEVICYAIQLIRCKAGLQAEYEFGDFQTIRLNLAAPDTYWNYWRPKRGNCLEKLENVVSQASVELACNLKLEIHSINYKDGAFDVKPFELE